ncbi:nicotinate-nucleotide adenylyltransferase [Butyrivibrio sp.]|jgi:nicotinate-nucleotide adenylyltransferase|uniref:nicotinate-nucleotide adenylyltransferase n=1 Tax=Butyrivibrio sp. TaxID=28121 RepID=UPI001B4E4DE9|nr:nicotinate-nucleotide adenylyltransferase [Butyrivibrio sp.]MBE5839759.1 nicotinate (nicotinamide) nucleotide adenylyltransferase [Butyrivibrio sp.]MBP3817186.1 nicotinate-nucleotide adenylyltransferase [Butyrivibrio sp.]MBQ9302232.1 nicotinate-nucleotide adenylyltransferase [Butyrivibrio sp.]
MESRKIGILGGTFDPIHNAHLLLGESAREQFGLDRVIFIPNNLAHLPNRTEVASGENRYQMVKMAIKDNPYFTCSRIEIDKDGGTYTYNTIQELKLMYPGDELFLILGGDSVIGIDNWYMAKELLQSCTILAAVREDDDLAALDKKRKELGDQFGADIRLLKFNRIDISATEVRNRVRTGRSIRYMVPDEVIEFLCIKGLYK